MITCLAAWLGFLLIRLAYAQTGPPFVGSVCDNPSHTPYHSVSEFPSDVIAMNPEEQLAMPDIKKARPVMLQRMMSVKLGIGHGRTRDKSPQPSGSANISHGSGESPPSKQEIAANCEKYIRAKDTQVSLMIFSSEFKLVKPFVFLSFIFESTDRYNVFHMTHT